MNDKEQADITITKLIKEEIKNVSIIGPCINEFMKQISKEEHRHLIKQKDGSFREETDKEFRNRLINKYSEKVNHKR